MVDITHRKNEIREVPLDCCWLAFATFRLAAADLGFLRCASRLTCSADDTSEVVGLRGVLEKILRITLVVRSFKEGMIFAQHPTSPHGESRMIAFSRAARESRRAQSEQIGAETILSFDEHRQQKAEQLSGVRTRRWNPHRES